MSRRRLPRRPSGSRRAALPAPTPPDPRCTIAVGRSTAARSVGQGVHRPALPHAGQLRFAGDAGDVVRAAAERGLTHLADHRPRPDRWRARGPGRGPGGPDGHRRRGGQDRRRRPHLRLPRAGHPARAVAPRRRSPLRASRAASSASRTRSTGCAARCCATTGMAALAPLVDWVEASQRPPRRQRQRPGRRIRARAWTAGRGGVGRPHDHRGRRSPTRPSRATRRRRPGCWPRSARRELVPGRASLLRPGLGRRSPSSSSGRAATAGRIRPAGPGRRQLGGRPVMNGPDGQDHRSMARRSGRPGRLGSHGDRATEVDRPRASRLASLAPAAPAADDHLDPRPAGDHRRLRRRSTAQTLAKVPGLIAGANPALVAARVRHLLRWLPAPRAALGDPPARDRTSASGSRTRPRSSSCRGSSTASCRPSSATSTAPTS